MEWLRQQATANFISRNCTAGPRAEDCAEVLTNGHCLLLVPTVALLTHCRFRQASAVAWQDHLSTIDGPWMDRSELAL